MNEHDTGILIDFLNYPLGSGESILKRFAELPETTKRGKPIHRFNNKNRLEQFVFIPGKRNARVLLVAHADTVWDELYGCEVKVQEKIIRENISNNLIQYINPDAGIGADDRAGCAILWLLKDTGHSLLITNGEEGKRAKQISGKQGSEWLMANYPVIAHEINYHHRFAVQFDRQNGTEFKCYTVGTEKFRQYIIEKTAYNEPDRERSTDIVILCSSICGVNLSIGYRNDHQIDESINIIEWQHTLDQCRKWLNETDLPVFSRFE